MLLGARELQLACNVLKQSNASYTNGQPSEAYAFWHTMCSENAADGFTFSSSCAQSSSCSKEPQLFVLMHAESRVHEDPVLCVS